MAVDANKHKLHYMSRPPPDRPPRMFLPGDEHEIYVLGVPQRVRMVYDADGVTPLHDNRKREAIVFEIRNGNVWTRLNGTINGPTDLRNEVYAHLGQPQPAGVQGTWALFTLIRHGARLGNWSQMRENWHNATYLPYLQSLGGAPGVGLGSGGRARGRGGGRGGGAAGRGGGRGGGPAPGLGPVSGFAPAAGSGPGGGGGFYPAPGAGVAPATALGPAPGFAPGAGVAPATALGPGPGFAPGFAPGAGGGVYPAPGAGVGPATALGPPAGVGPAGGGGRGGGGGGNAGRGAGRGGNP